MRDASLIAESTSSNVSGVNRFYLIYSLKEGEGRGIYPAAVSFWSRDA